MTTLLPGKQLTRQWPAHRQPFRAGYPQLVRNPPVQPRLYWTARLPPVTSMRRRVLSHRRFMQYNRLIALVLLANAALAVYGFTERDWWQAASVNLDAIGKAVVINFALAILIRQRRVINLLFRLATAAPTSWPLKLRWALAKVYHFGGLHVGGAIAGTVWFIVLIAGLTREAWRGAVRLLAGTLEVSYVLVGLLLAMIVTAAPPMRRRFHDSFERTHRFAGWSVLLLFWAQTVLLAVAQSPTDSVASELLGSFNLWVLAVLTVSVAAPWARLRKVPVAIDRPSSHVAVVRLDYGLTPVNGTGSAMSLSPLTEWHGFANIDVPGRTGYRIVVSRAGDWTSNFIDNPPSHVWVRGGPTRGMASVDRLFERVVFVATGSGIGPILTCLLGRSMPTRLVWATRSPRTVFGDALVNEVLRTEPGAIVWDTTAHGKPDMVALAYGAYHSFNAEAVVCISNEKLTWQIVHGLESRGVPAFGAIWDS